MNLNIIVAGVGGQGSILASHIIAEASIRTDEHNVRVGETFGAAMRGGAVASHVRIGDVHGPLVGRGQADMILALEPLEGLRVGVEYIKKGGIAILNTETFPPVDVKIGAACYPSIEEVERAFVRLGASVVTFDAGRHAREAGTPKAMNVVMLGAAFASGLFPFDEAAMIGAIRERVPPKFLEVNLEAFGRGRKAYAEAGGAGRRKT